MFYKNKLCLISISISYKLHTFKYKSGLIFNRHLNGENIRKK